ncbi:hypothetical protein [Aeromicrobium sp. UC242_57]|uniref:hypothetical protein n=1 Tax=Aeromicrobium sp. UC242_57 TaxID=3374624 RepID=UPI0037B20BA0
MTAIFDLTFLLVVLFPGTIAVVAGMAAVTRLSTLRAPRRNRDLLRVAAYGSAGTCAVASLVTFSIWFWSFDAADTPAGVSLAVERAINLGQAITGGTFVAAMVVAVASVVIERRAAASSRSRSGAHDLDDAKGVTRR